MNKIRFKWYSLSIFYFWFLCWLLKSLNIWNQKGNLYAKFGGLHRTKSNEISYSSRSIWFFSLANWQKIFLPVFSPGDLALTIWLSPCHSANKNLSWGLPICSFMRFICLEFFSSKYLVVVVNCGVVSRGNVIKLN